MTDEQPRDMLPRTERSRERPDIARAFGRQVWLAARVVQVRLRFVVVLVVAFLVVGLWGDLRNYWDTLTHWLTGASVVQNSVSDDTEYWCPMDAGIISDWPAICPVCNMDLVRRKKGEAVILPEGLVARMQFSPYRIQLAGIKTSVVRRQKLVREVIVAGRLIDAAMELPPPDTSPTGPPNLTSSFILDCDTYASDMALLTPGRQARVFVEELPGLEPFPGCVVVNEKAVPLPANRPDTIVRIQLNGRPAGLRPGMFCTAHIAVPLAEIEGFAALLAGQANGESSDVVAVPETAIIDTGTRRVVFIETMPGMFDGVEVRLGPRCGDYFPVLAGIEAGQKVATVGAFLIDAEARLSPNLAANYFGASRATVVGSAAGTSRAVTSDVPRDRPNKQKKSAAIKLSASDQQLANLQKTCPVTGASLDSMGGPIAVNVEGKKVFICCKGCESALKKEPKKYLAKLKVN